MNPVLRLVAFILGGAAAAAATPAPAAEPPMDQPKPSPASQAAEPPGPAPGAESYAPQLTEVVSPDPVVETKASLYDTIWSYAKLYSNEENPVIQDLSFSGRFQLDYAMIQEEDFEDWDIRRFRLGAKTKLLHDFTVHGEVDITPDKDIVFLRFTDAYIAWSRSQALEVTVGKHSAPFTMDGSTSSKNLLTIDRSNLSNNLWFPQQYFPGVSAAGDRGSWLYHVGLYSSGGANRYFGNFEGKFFILSSLGYNLADRLGTEEALVRFDYVFNDEDPNNTFTRPLGQVFSLNFRLEEKKWGVRTDLSGGLGYLGQSDLWGAMVTPHYNVTEKFQAVARYTYLASAEDNGIRFARYEGVAIPGGRGDRYNEVYLGLNYYFYGNKLKIQTGVDYADMQDAADDGGAYSGWGWTTGLRVSW